MRHPCRGEAERRCVHALLLERDIECRDLPKAGDDVDDIGTQRPASLADLLALGGAAGA